MPVFNLCELQNRYNLDNKLKTTTNLEKQMKGWKKNSDKMNTLFSNFSWQH